MCAKDQLIDLMPDLVLFNDGTRNLSHMFEGEVVQHRGRVGVFSFSHVKVRGKRECTPLGFVGVLVWIAEHIRGTVNAVDGGIFTVDMFFHPLKVHPILSQVGQALGAIDSVR